MTRRNRLKALEEIAALYKAIVGADAGTEC